MMHLCPEQTPSNGAPTLLWAVSDIMTWRISDFSTIPAPGSSAHLRPDSNTLTLMVIDVLSSLAFNTEEKKERGRKRDACGQLLKEIKNIGMERSSRERKKRTG